MGAINSSGLNSHAKYSLKWIDIDLSFFWISFGEFLKGTTAGALNNPFLPEFTEYIVYTNLDSHEEEANNPIVEEPSQRSVLVKILLKFPIDLDLCTN